ncbi:hypothetical protein BDV18DRAFT_132662 [Aspergillus unguis]
MTSMHIPGHQQSISNLSPKIILCMVSTSMLEVLFIVQMLVCLKSLDVRGSIPGSSGS